MSRTITAMFDQRSEAEAAKARLEAANVHADHVRVHDQSSPGFGEQSRSTHEEPGIWGSVKNAFLPDEDRHTYEEGMRRGGFLLTADVDENQVDEAVRVLEQDSGTIDIDDRSQQWKSSGWNAAPATGAMGAKGTGSARSTNDAGEQVIPIVEEQLVVGKREVGRGGVRVRSYVTEKPVHEQIRLRNERVDVQRRTVDQPLSAADGDAFRERTIDMTATGEEAVVGKNARVVEEVVVSKTSDERVERIDDTVRRTDVEIDRDAGLGSRDADRR